MRSLAIALFVVVMAVPEVAVASPSPGSWGVGLRTTSLGLESSLRPDSAIAMDGGGLHLRFRANRRWEIEFASEHLHGELAHGALVRDSEAATLSTLLHLSPARRWWDWYLIAGFGSTADTVTYEKGDGSLATESFASTHVHFGLGIERRYGHLVIGAELRAVGMARDDDQLSQPRYEKIDGPVPWEASGSQLNLTATYYW